MLEMSGKALFIALFVSASDDPALRLAVRDRLFARFGVFVSKYEVAQSQAEVKSMGEGKTLSARPRDVGLIIDAAAVLQSTGVRELLFVLLALAFPHPLWLTSEIIRGYVNAWAVQRATEDQLCSRMVGNA